MGYFRTIALTTPAVVTGLLLHADVIGFLTLYAGTFVVVAALYASCPQPAAGYDEDIEARTLRLTHPRSSL